MANEKFLKKVYDQYLNTDYEYGVSNLNPKREISAESIESTKDITDRIEEEIRRQYNELKAKADKLLDFSIPKAEDMLDAADQQVESGNFLGAKRPEGNGPQLPKVGGSVLDDTLDDSPLLDDIDDLILKLAIMLDVPPIPHEGGEPGKPKFVDPMAALDIPSGAMLCGANSYGGTDDPLGPTAMDAEDGAAAKMALITKKISSFTGLENGAEKDTNTLVIQEGEEGGTGKDGRESDFMPADLPQPKDVGNPWLNQMPVSCILQDLTILRVVLVICKILGTLKRVLLLILTIAVPIIKIASRCCGCWVNPPSAAEAIQLVLEKVGAMIMGIIGDLLQMLWNMLGFDCVDEMASSLLDQITEALTAIGGISCIGSKEWSMVTDAYKSAMDEAIENANKMKDSLKEWEKENQNIGEKAKQAFNDVLGNCKAQGKEMLTDMFTKNRTAGALSAMDKAAKKMMDNLAKEKENLVKLSQENQEKQRKAAEASNTPTMGSLDGGMQE